MDRLKKFIAQRYVLSPAICLVIGITLHLKGHRLTNEQQATLQHEVAGIFDILAFIAGQSSIRFGLNQKRAEAIKETVDINAKIANPKEPTGDLLPMTVAQVEQAKAEEEK